MLNYCLKKDILEELSNTLQKIPKHYIYIFFIVFFLNILSYGYIITEFLFTNHTFPNISNQPFPSYRSREGRWTHDLIYFLQGGAGISFFQTIIAIFIQITAGILFAIALNRKDSNSLIISASVISLIPYVNDYYGFSGDSIMFATGDLLAVMGIAISKRSIRHMLAAAIILKLSIACYQPKIATIAVVSSAYSLCLLCDWDGSREDIRRILKSILLLFLTCLLAVAMYLMVLNAMNLLDLIPAHEQFTRRLSTASVDQIPHLVNLAIIDLYYRLFISEPLIPQYIKQILVVICTISLILTIIKLISSGNEKKYIIIVLACILLVFFVLILSTNLAFIVSPNSYWNAGRFRTTYGFFFVSLIILAIREKNTLYKNFSILVLFILIHSYVVTNGYINQQAQIKNITEFSRINRLLIRIESLEGFDYDKKYAIVILGNFSLASVPQLRYPRSEQNYTVISNLVERFFIRYRHIEILNYFSIKNLFRKANQDELIRAKKYAISHNPYPAEDSIALLDDDLIVVILEKYYPKIPHT